MARIDNLSVIKGNWLQDAKLNDSISYASMYEVPSIDAITDWDTLTEDCGEMSASIKNSVAYTFKY